MSDLKRQYNINIILESEKRLQELSTPIPNEEAFSINILEKVVLINFHKDRIQRIKNKWGIK